MKLPKLVLDYLEKCETPYMTGIIYVYFCSMQVGQSRNTRVIHNVIEQALGKKLPRSSTGPRMSEVASSPLIRNFIVENKVGIRGNSSMYTRTEATQTLSTVDELIESLKEQDYYKREQDKQAKECKAAKLVNIEGGDVYDSDRHISAMLKALSKYAPDALTEEQKLLVAVSALFAGARVPERKMELELNIPSLGPRITELTNATGAKYVKRIPGRLVEIVSIPKNAEFGAIIDSIHTCKRAKTKLNKELQEQGIIDAGGFKLV